MSCHNTFVPRATQRPAIPTAAWTKINAVPGALRRQLSVSNEDESTIFRLAVLPAGSAAPTSPTAGRPLHPGMEYFEDQQTGMSVSDLYAYQSSGGDLATLAITEGE